MSEKISFNNFKAFGSHPQTFSKKPITLIYGPNSIGKSSLIHLMAYRHEIFKSNFSPIEIKEGDPISLNGFQSFIHKKDMNQTLRWKEESRNSSIDIELGIADEDKSVLPLNIVYSIDNERLVRFEYDKDDHYKINVNFDHPRVRNYLNKIVEKNENWDEEKIDKSLKDSGVNFYTIHKKNFLFKEERGFLLDNNYAIFHGEAFAERDRIIFEEWTPEMDKIKSNIKSNQPMATITLNPYSSDDSTYDNTKLLNEVINKNPTPTSIRFPYGVFYLEDDVELSLELFVTQFVTEMTFKINASLNKKTFYHIGPLRHYPERDSVTKNNSAEDVNSKNFWTILFERKDIREKLNEWLSNEKLDMPYEIVLNKLYDLSALFEEDKEQYTKKDIESLTTFREELLFRDKRNGTLVHHRDLGLGVTQILPVIGGSMFLKEHIVGVEQPELHLHPKIQAEIADEFIRGYKENNNEYFIETHSEHLLLRIMKRMRYTANDKEDRDKSLDLTPDDVCLLYVDNDGVSTYIQELRLSDSGKLLDRWPNGFFEEGFKERFS